MPGNCETHPRPVGAGLGWEKKCIIPHTRRGLTLVAATSNITVFSILMWFLLHKLITILERRFVILLSCVFAFFF